MGIAGNLGIWFHSFLSNCYHFVRLLGGVSTASPVINGVPQGTVMGPLLFLIIMSDIDVLNSKVVSCADDAHLYSKITYVEDCDSVDCGRYSLCNGTFRSLLIKDTTTLAYSVVYTYQLKILFVF